MYTDALELMSRESTNLRVAQGFGRTLALDYVTLNRANRVSAAHVVVVARAFALLLVTNSAFRTVVVAGAIRRVVTATRVRIAQQSVGTNARKRSRSVLAFRGLVTRALVALVHVLTLAVSQFVTVVTRAHALVFERFTVAVSTVDRIARA